MHTGCWKRRQTPLKTNKRIWELDALRGTCILIMVAVHLTFDLTELYGFFPRPRVRIYEILLSWGGVVFFLISGICATLSSRSFRRGALVFGCGMGITAITYLADQNLAVYFGVLHCLGLCMMLWTVFRSFSTAALTAASAGIILLGLLFQQLQVSTSTLFWLGLTTPFFSSADFFPLFPFLGFFLLGAVLGRLIYKEKRTLLPKIDAQRPLLCFLQFCGRHSLPIYLLHQPVILGILELID